jgi:hypothetical protein
MEKLKEFMLLFRMEPSNQQPTEAQLNEMHQQWGDFIGNIAMQGKLVSTHQLGFEGVQIAADQSTTQGIYVANNQILAGNMVLKAINIDQAVNLAKKCPILLMGGTVEVREIQPM